MITALALFGGSMVILSDPIFQGMAVSLIFGGAVATLLTLLIIPLGCISAGNSLGGCPGGNGGGSQGGSPSNAPAGGHTAKSGKGIGQVAKDTVVYTSMYFVSLLTGLVAGIAGWFAAGSKLLRKRKARDTAKREVVRQQAKVQAVAAVAKEVAADKKTLTPQVAKPEPVAVVAPVTIVEDDDTRQEQPVVAVVADQQAVDPDTHDAKPQNDMPPASGDIQERKKPSGRRGIKLKTDI